VIHVHIERLIVDGFAVAPGESSTLRRSIQRELTGLLRESGVAPELMGGGAVESRPAGTIAGSSSASALGRQVAHALHGAVAEPR